jgi:hypothetical protein
MGQVCIDPNASGLVAAYDMFPVNGTIADLSGNGNTGTVNGPVFEYTEIGGSMRFAANGEIVTTLYTGNPASFSVGGWYNLKSKGQNNFGRLFSKGSGKLELYANNSDVNLNLRYENGSGFQDLLLSNAYSLNKTFFIMVTYSSGVISTYINDSLFDTTLDTIVLDSSALIIGDLSGSNASDGNISNFQFFERALSQSEITALYNCGASAVNFKTDYGVVESVAAESAPGELSNSPFRKESGTWKISTDTIGGDTCKVIECVTAGVLQVPTAYFFGDDTQAAYGSWDFWVYRKGISNNTRIAFSSNQASDPSDSSFNGYLSLSSSAGRVILQKVTNGVGSSFIFTDVDFQAIETWYRHKITRNSGGEFYYYFDNELLDVSGGGGTNPATDTTYTTSKYIVLDLDAGDKIAYAAPNGDCSIVKYQGVV